MYDEALITGIATLISDYRKTELPAQLDANHVRRWISQFDKTEQQVVLQETFHVLTRNYYKTERIHCFLRQVVDRLAESAPLDQYVFVDVQKQGVSQKLIYQQIDVDYRSRGFECIHKSEDFGEHPGKFVYVDDGLYTGKRSKDDLLPLIEKLPANSTLYVFYMLVYSNGYSYWSGRISECGRERGITVVFDYGKMLGNDRNNKCASVDIVWPSRDCRRLDEVQQYEKQLRETGKAHFIYSHEVSEENRSLFSSAEAGKRVSEIFLKYGLKLTNAIRKPTFRPLGFDRAPSFGFGSFCATDWNISNTCPLVLWWGDMEDPNRMVGSWYPLLPRRSNETLYREISEYEEEFSLAKYRDILLTVYRLASRERRIGAQKRAIRIEELFQEPFDLAEPGKRRERSNLYQYLNSQDMNTIQVIQTVMYIGRDYAAPQYSEEEWEGIMERKAEDPEYDIPKPKLRVSNPEELLLAWRMDLDWVKGWQGKHIEIEQIYQKSQSLDQYLSRAFEILGV